MYENPTWQSSIIFCFFSSAEDPERFFQGIAINGSSGLLWSENVVIKLRLDRYRSDDTPQSSGTGQEQGRYVSF